jgi:hypothetical protein
MQIRQLVNGRSIVEQVEWTEGSRSFQSTIQKPAVQKQSARISQKIQSSQVQKTQKCIETEQQDDER